MRTFAVFYFKRYWLIVGLRIGILRGILYRLKCALLPFCISKILADCWP